MQFIQCLFSPRLYKVYRKESRDVVYEADTLEMLGDKIISTARTVYKLGCYSSPIIGMFLYQKGYFSRLDDKRGSALVTLCLAGILMFSFFLRGLGRARNHRYMEFLKVLNKPRGDMAAYLTEIRNYDFDFTAWPVTYSVPQHSGQPSAKDPRPLLQHAPTRALAWVAAHTFGLRMIYPGSIGLLHNLMHSSLVTGRTDLVEEFNGQRAKVRTADGNTIDTMFVDNRGGGRQGRHLVVCCEGNMGFYELGLMTTPAKCGYSALGWNHPGFVTSTGLPYPSQEQNAVDAVIQYAINQLGFEPRSIVMFGWSIGGYSAAWAAQAYPELGGVILDATFSDILPLAKKQMPKSWEPLVTEVIRSHVNLDVAGLMLKYSGPVYIIRRTEDEIISLVEGQVSTNCVNELVLRVAGARHAERWPALAARVKALLQASGAARRGPSPDPAVELLDKYLRDFRASHCAPLPLSEFEIAMRRILAPSSE